MKKAALSFFIITGLLVISGCGRIVDWGSCTFEQSSDLVDFTEKSKSYLRSVTVHNQFLPSAKFSVLPLFDEVLEPYAAIYARRMGMSCNEKENFLEQWKSDHVLGLTFYVVSLYEYPLGQHDSVWGIFAEIDCTIYRPSCIQKIELSPEFKAFFGKEYTIFREAYAVSFDSDASALNDVPIKLFFRSITKQALLCWNTFEDDKDCYRC